ncbi:phosphatase, partial [Escherichia coli]|nr:phosphatase [Escherichia coli]
ILYMDAQYTAKFRKLAGEKLPHDQFKKAIASLHPDFSHRSGIRMINDGHYKFARYFSLKQHHIPATRAELLENNDFELFVLVNDPEEKHNLARESETYRVLLITMYDKLKQLTAAEIVADDSSKMPPFEGSQWNPTEAKMHK